MEYEAIVAIVERGRANGVAKKACESGASGATIAFGRGFGEHILSVFSNLQVEPSKEFVLIISEKSDTERLLGIVVEAARIHEAGKGIAFTLPIGNLVGMDREKKYDV
ncbi:MAG: P-II family nitrogen regulator [Planctomycetota bacterium]|jgi:nitrogen regulatory protein PII|nr:P-II family nitrogen regulator [Planctomycetota bacterium]